MKNYVSRLLSELVLGGTALLMACGGGSPSQPPQPPPPPTQYTASYNVQANNVSKANAYVDNETGALNHGPTGKTKTVSQADASHNYTFDFPYTSDDKLNMGADSTLQFAQASPTFYKFQRTEPGLGTTNKPLQPVYLLERFKENGSQAGYNYYELLDWLTWMTGNSKAVNWSYPVNVFLNSNDPNAGNYPAVLKAALDSWESGCNPSLKDKMFSYVSAKPDVGIDIVYVTDPLKPDIQPLQAVYGTDSNGNTILKHVTFEANTIAVNSVDINSMAKHETGHGALRFVEEDTETNHIMNPGNAANNPSATQSPVECKAAAARYGVQNGFDKKQWSK